MGLLSSLKNVVKVVTTVSPLQALQNVAAGLPITNTQGVGVKASAKVVATILNPFNDKNLTFRTENKTVKSIAETALNNPYTTSAAIGVIGGIAATSGAAAATVKALTPASTLGKIGAVAAIPIVAGAIAQQPAAVIKGIATAPSALANFGGNAANLAADPSISNLKELVKENPVVSGIAAGAGAIAIGGGLGLAANTVATYLNSKATKENTLGTGSAESTPVGINMPSAGGSIVPVSGDATSSKVPLTPATQEVRATTSTGKRKKRTTKQTPSVKQSVTVNLQNRTLKIAKYLSTRTLLR